MDMNASARLLAGLALGASLLLGACSGGTPPPAPMPPTDPVDPPPAKSAAQLAYEDAEMKVAAAKAASGEAAVRAAVTAARTALDAASSAAASALSSARAAVDAAGDSPTAAQSAALGAATRAVAAAAALDREERPALDRLLEAFSWFGSPLMREPVPSGEAVQPREGTNTVAIARTARTTGPAGSLRANPDALTAASLPAVRHSAGDRVFSLGGDEFPSGGYAVRLAEDTALDASLVTGVKLTSTGLEIRVGGTKPAGGTNAAATDYSDMRKKLTQSVQGNADGSDSAPNGQNGWDLRLTFDAPASMRVPATARSDIEGQATSWQGNGDFYWRAVARADASQTGTGANAEAGSLRQPAGYRDLGSYEVWLSNHIGADLNRGPNYPQDDDQLYLDYAAYGLFRYTADPLVAAAGDDFGRLQSLHFGYLAFADADGRRTSDIGTAISNGRFEGQTLATVVDGAQSATRTATLLRGDVELTVSIPKGSGSATVQGTLDAFEQWGGEYWRDYTALTSVALGSASIGADGSFSGTATATPTDDFGNSGAGVFRGAFYGPRSDSADLEAAGSWTVGPTATASDDRIIVGSFGAKQRDD